jgi:mono/diheme cytochrome c family protein
MDKSNAPRPNWVMPAVLLAVLAGTVTGGVLVYQYAWPGKRPGPDADADRGGRAVSQKDDAAAKAAFLEAYKVLMHPRCMNCHPDGDVPLQGDDSRLHLQNVQRGTDGKGKFALKCASCHQDKNLPGANMPPGNPNWHLPPAEMRMVFQGKTPGELARQLKDPKLNGGKTLEQILEHVTQDKLVLWGWDPGDGRTRPPLSHDEFATAMRTWVEKGAAVPD